MYSQKSNKRSQLYEKENMKRIHLKFLKEEYEDIIIPAAKASGLPVATYIKQALYAQIERDSKNT